MILEDEFNIPRKNLLLLQDFDVIEVSGPIVVNLIITPKDDVLAEADLDLAEVDV
jgi:hypothetical protein